MIYDVGFTKRKKDADCKMR